ncbi:cell wall-associated NlpC family hydrolase [Nocardiopsis sp. Huas11]|uniref:C40 family peptidase n=1 Tax=Nocardiopsis sp. Huas11 TaxID=2183912 RepID=UPI000F1D1AF2|nr:C40 family peptidase [Nocardiopsis sp. Huas11]RKS06183.1 cell wall-associated NlpC family hydrolase [Nocardiopsis sp. Huas11]
MNGHRVGFAAAARVWSRMRGFLLAPRGRDGDRGAAARVVGGVAGLAAMGGIAFASAMCGPADTTTDAFGPTGSGLTGNAFQTSASSSAAHETTSPSEYDGAESVSSYADPVVQRVAADSGSDGGCAQDSGVDQAAFRGNAGASHRGVVEYVRGQIGKPYVWGATGPDSFDCSGLAMAAWNDVGVQIPRTTFDQWNGGMPSSTWDGADVAVVQKKPLDVDSLQPGDLLYLHYKGDPPSHMGIYVGGGEMIHAPAPGSTVTQVSIETPYYQDHFVGAIRLDPGPATAEV